MKELDDLSLIELAQDGNKEAEKILLLRYSNCVDIIVNSLNPTTNNHDDLVQEGLIAMTRAIKSFDTTKNASFKTYASRCIKNAMLDLIKKDTTHSSKIIYEVDLSDDHKEHIDNISTPELTPEESLLLKEDNELFYDDLKGVLKESEVSILNLYLSAMSYREISDQLGIPVKQVDNTLSQTKKKLKKLLSDLK